MFEIVKEQASEIRRFRHHSKKYMYKASSDSFRLFSTGRKLTITPTKKIEVYNKIRNLLRLIKEIVSIDGEQIIGAMYWRGADAAMWSA